MSSKRLEALPVRGEALEPAFAQLQDTRGRTVRYLRLSVTDRCNLRCMYCRSSARERCIPHQQVLRYEEMLRLVRVAVPLGVEKIRLTGGEPFVRKGFLQFLEMLRGTFPEVDVRVTTNATLVRPYAAALREMGVTAINISLDSFHAGTFAAITGRDLLGEVRAGLDAIMAQGIRVKINAVGLRGINDGEMASFIDFARRNPVDVRFIEFMPIGSASQWSTRHFWPAADILATASRYAALTPLQLQGRGGHQYAGPARMFAVDGGPGRFGLITPLTNHFCSQCNRLRITSDGYLRTCLFADREYALRGIIRHPRLTDAALQRVLVAANKVKPLGVELLEARRGYPVARKGMVSIGG